MKRWGYEFIDNFTQGGVCIYEGKNSTTSDDKTVLGLPKPATFPQEDEDREGFIGWVGEGGSVFQWHPELRIGFGYVPFDLNFHDLTNKRGARL